MNTRLEAAHRPLPAKKIQQHWPEGEPPMTPDGLMTTLKRATADGEVERLGKGGRFDPFRYYLPRRGPTTDPLDPSHLLGDWPEPDPTDLHRKAQAL